MLARLGHPTKARNPAYEMLARSIERDTRFTRYTDAFAMYINYVQVDVSHLLRA